MISSFAKWLPECKRKENQTRNCDACTVQWCDFLIANDLGRYPWPTCTSTFIDPTGSRALTLSSKSQPSRLYKGLFGEILSREGNKKSVFY